MTKKVPLDVFKIGDSVEYFLSSSGRKFKPRFEKGVIVKDLKNHWSIKTINSFGDEILKAIKKEKVVKDDKNKLGENKALSGVSQRSKA